MFLNSLSKISCITYIQSSVFASKNINIPHGITLAIRSFSEELQSEALAKDCFLFLRVLRWFTSPGVASLSFLRHSNRLTAFEKAQNDWAPHSLTLMGTPVIQRQGWGGFTSPGYPIRESRDQRLPAPPPGLSQLSHALHRRGLPRHPPPALTSSSLGGSTKF